MHGCDLNKQIKKIIIVQVEFLHNFLRFAKEKRSAMQKGRHSKNSYHQLMLRLDFHHRFAHLLILVFGAVIDNRMVLIFAKIFSLN